jgi:antitoxin (DNA-binding transcriptional repressor) of toxin-antitoxin stability system
MLRAVRAGAVYTVTDRGEPIADIAPHRSGPWRPAGEVEDVLRKLGMNRAWLDDQSALRDDVELPDPFQSAP